MKKVFLQVDPVDEKSNMVCIDILVLVELALELVEVGVEEVVWRWGKWVVVRKIGSICVGMWMFCGREG